MRTDRSADTLVATSPAAASARLCRSRRRRGVVALLAMLFLTLIAVLTVGLCETTNTQVQVSSNDATLAEVSTAAESAAEFMRYQMGEMNLPYGTTSSNLLTNAATAMGVNLNGQPCMGGKTVNVTAGTIYIPSQTAYINLDSAGRTKFRATITQPAGTTTLLVTTRAYSSVSSVTRAVQLTYQNAGGTYALAGVSGVTMKLGAYTDSYASAKGDYASQTPGTKGTIVSNGNISLNDTVKITGDARPGAGKTVTFAGTAKVTGRTTPLPAAVSYPSVTLPATYTDLGDVNMSSGTQSLPGGTYVLNSLVLSGTANIIWTGPVKLYIKSSYSVTGGATIQTYGNNPANRTLYFLPTCTTATWSGTTSSVGELYAPDTAFTISGSVSLYGRITAKSIVNSSTGGMHSDESLPNPGGSGPFAPIAGSYREIP